MSVDGSWNRTDFALLGSEIVRQKSPYSWNKSDSKLRLTPPHYSWFTADHSADRWLLLVLTGFFQYLPVF